MKLSRLQKGILDILRDFGQWTSTHAVPHVAMADAVWIAIFWSFIFLGALALTIYQVYTLIARFLSYPVILNARLEYGTSAFPRITFCSANPWKLSGVVGTPLDGLLEVRAYNLQQANDQYGFEAPFTMRESVRAARWTRLMFEDLVSLDESGIADVGYTLEDLLVSCTFVNADCDLRLFGDYYDAFYGHCHVFNPNGTLSTSRAGPSYGLRLTLRSVLSDYLPWTETAGITFSVSGPNGSAFEDAMGYFAPNARATSAGVKFYFRDKLSGPYNDCVDNGDGLVNYYGDVYEVEGCLRSCMQDRIISMCSCYDPQFERASNATAISCYKMSDVNGANCHCPFTCNQSYYQVSMSQARWPARTYIPPECLNATFMSWTNLNECRSWYEMNTALIEVYYERMNYESDIESVGYNLFNLIADTGGQLGLWLGMSVVSVFEFVLLVILLIMYVVIRPKKVTLEGYDYWKEFEKQAENRKDNDPDLIYGDSDHEDGGPMPPKIQEANPTQRVTDLSAPNSMPVAAAANVLPESTPPIPSEPAAASTAAKAEDPTPPAVTAPASAPVEPSAPEASAPANASGAAAKQKQE
ncbi:DEgenerin Like [Aphelenchoides fujianensis]|nr:DEgenerin Like [Aphelenchoides fujianensis]